MDNNFNTLLLKIYNKKEKNLGEEEISELEFLSETAGLNVVHKEIFTLNKINPNTYIGEGKLETINNIIIENDINYLIFDDELSPTQHRNIDKFFNNKIEIWDRTALILNIFSLHAKTHEGQLQVQLAQYEYLLPRLTGMWTHFIRQAGGKAGGASGGVGVRGVGETQLELDRRQARKQIFKLRKKIEAIKRHRNQYRYRRKRNNIPIISIVGYTNTGKSTLLKRLTNSNILVANQLFSTLDPKTKKVKLSTGREVLFSDTVGFIKNLPHQLVVAFRATMEEIKDASLILIIADASNNNSNMQLEEVKKVLHELKVENIPSLTVWNKADKIEFNKKKYPKNKLFISALKNKGIENLITKIESTLNEKLIKFNITINYDQSHILEKIHTHCSIIKKKFLKNGIKISGFAPKNINLT